MSELNQTTNQEPKHSIKFDHAPDGEIEFSGVSIFKDLMPIGALALTGQYVSDPEKGMYKRYATDKKGLQAIIDKQEETLLLLHDTMKSLGLVLAVSDSEKLSGLGVVDSLGWLITGLSELAMDIDWLHDEMVGALSTLEESA